MRHTGVVALLAAPGTIGVGLRVLTVGAEVFFIERVTHLIHTEPDSDLWINYGVPWIAVVFEGIEPDTPTTND